MSAFGPVPRLDAPALLDLINATYGLELSYLGPAERGNVGAGYVADPTGRRSVLTWQQDADAGRHRQIAGLLEVARGRGLPVPRYEHVLQVGPSVALIQELLPGGPPERAEQGLVEQLVAVNAALRGALADRTDLPAPDLYLLRSGPGFCLHEPLRSYSDRTRRLLGWIHEVGASGPTALSGVDLVHLDFQPANVLVEAGRLTGVIDWDGAGRGDARFDLMVLYFGLHSEGGSAATIGWLNELLDAELPAELFRAYWASLSLRLVDWAIRHYTAADVERWLDLADRGMR
jgi:Ser/Thr protein kinase RdoA (MazF antagonist)